MESLSNQVSQFTSLPVITLVYLAITVTLSAITSYVRTQSYKHLIAGNPELVFEDIIIPSLQLVPAHFVFHPWTIWTSAFVETSPFQFISGLIIVYVGMTFLESQWNPKSSQQPLSEALKFTSIIIIISNLVCIVLITLSNLLYGSLSNLNLPLHYGLYILVLPFATVAKQLTPETNIRVLSLFKFRLKRLPFILLTLTLVISVIKGNAAPFLPAFVSFFTSWCYLRYFQFSPAINAFEVLPSPVSQAGSVNTPSRGDPSDTFALVEFFPDLAKPYVKPLFDGIYQLSVLLGLVRPWNDEEVDIGNIRSTFRVSGTQGITTSKPTSGDPISSDIDERRRQVALKVLEQSVDPKE
ncbi:hypothetical protein PICMEDRAFT_35735 [Pichia membranifaciens NRRL Y-2026]|uniref:Peptidase S54 rhomboid domain-containing protein n=1 Tax=Pichia membranifaciens NRRL Y-2026 TaxID=763406 RepID=A0A1E3NFM7_9ASCO|nr:hypothetical protein PICMEDRAFT_35735 [Pichia membranifaciens NRRL Y-2026]ODQ44940.1 hypothetical protein PICMEDRAFT_35735 [Pichia membranifaciens NRRL Y-2026]